MNNSIFKDNFLNELEEKLENHCSDGSCFRRQDVCDQFDLNLAFESTIGAIIKTGLIAGYEIKRGPSGGISKIGTKPKPKEKKSPTKAIVDNDFLELLESSLTHLCSGTDCVTRQQIAQAMGVPGTETELKISRAIKSGQLVGYESRRGPKGGIRRCEIKPSEAEEVRASVGSPTATEDAQAMAQKLVDKGRQIVDELASDVLESSFSDEGGNDDVADSQGAHRADEGQHEHFQLRLNPNESETVNSDDKGLSDELKNLGNKFLSGALK